MSFCKIMRRIDSSFFFFLNYSYLIGWKGSNLIPSPSQKAECQATCPLSPSWSFSLWSRLLLALLSETNPRCCTATPWTCLILPQPPVSQKPGSLPWLQCPLLHSGPQSWFPASQPSDNENFQSFSPSLTENAWWLSHTPQVHCHSKSC